MSSSKSVVWTKNTEIRENFDNKNPLDEPIKGYLKTFLEIINWNLFQLHVFF